MSWRSLTPQDYPAVIQALEHLELESPARGCVHSTSLAKGLAMVDQVRIEQNAYVVSEHYLLLVSEVTPWYGGDRVLQEELVLALKPGGNIAHIVPTMRELAKGRRCTGFTVSDSSIGMRLTRVYTRQGMRPITTTLYEDVPNG